MWKMYGGGRESVAVQSTRSKLGALIESNTSFLKKYTLEGAVADVDYLDGLKSPSEEVQEKIYQIVFERDRDYQIGLFAIKPSVYRFEEEVRAIIYPKRNLLDPIENLHPGLHIPIRSSEPHQPALSQFIETVYIHPMLRDDSMMTQTIKDIHERFNVPAIPLVANKIEAMGVDIALPSVTGD